ncbi:MAG TPA: hypothetical protein VIK72_04640 [Clostridiaceae bacterium]
MLDINDIISGDFSRYPEETQAYLRNYNNILREQIKEELIKERADSLIKGLDKNNETFMELISDILENGVKGLNKMTTEVLLNIYLEKKGYENFIKLLSNIESIIALRDGVK